MKAVRITFAVLVLAAVTAVAYVAVPVGAEVPAAACNGGSGIGC